MYDLELRDYYIFKLHDMHQTQGSYISQLRTNDQLDCAYFIKRARLGLGPSLLALLRLSFISLHISICIHFTPKVICILTSAKSLSLFSCTYSPSFNHWLDRRVQMKIIEILLVTCGPKLSSTIIFIDFFKILFIFNFLHIFCSLLILTKEFKRLNLCLVLIVHVEKFSLLPKINFAWSIHARWHNFVWFSLSLSPFI